MNIKNLEPYNMGTLKIKKQDALIAHEKANRNGKKLLENLLGKKTFVKNPKDRIKTIDDILEDNNVTMEQLNRMFENTPEHLKWQYVAELLCKSLNEDWTPDWDNSNEYKYYPWFKMSSSGFRCDGFDYWDSVSVVGSRLCFKSRDLAIYAGQQFTDVYKKFMI